MKLLIFGTWIILVSCNESYRLKQASISSSAYVLKGNVSTFAGSAGNVNGYRTDVTFDWNWDMAIGQDGSIYVMDAGVYR